MKKVTTLCAAISAFTLSTGFANAAAHAPVLSIDGVVIATSAPAPDFLDMDEIFSGWVYRIAETQALQMNDFDNPGMIFVDIALDTWNRVEGSEGKSCASCHLAGPEEFAGLRTVTPRWNEEAGAVWSMEDYVNYSRVEYMGAEPWKVGGADMNGMVALISLQSRGMPMNVAIDGPAAETWALGEELYFTRFGQLDMACANCHEDNYGVMIRADRLSQGQSNGFPAYRLKNAKLNGIQSRFLGCMQNIRATPFSVGGPEFLALELYVASRGNGLSVEGPSVRN